MIERYDILGLGCVAIDDLLYVAGYPAADSKTRVQHRSRQCGGLTATALVAASRAGARCVYAGTLGTDGLSDFALDRLQAEGIDVSWVRRLEGARPIHSTVIVDQAGQTRTIFYDLENVYGAQPDWPPENVVLAARVLFVDHFGAEGMIRAARLARAAGMPVVADFESDGGPQFAELLGLVDHVIVSQSFAEQLTETSNPAEAVGRLWNNGRSAILVTCGANGCWARDATYSHEPRHFQAFQVAVKDTTGCGDVFHGAYAAALARGESFEDRVRFASAAAALKAAGQGGQGAIPLKTEIESFLAERGR